MKNNDKFGLYAAWLVAVLFYAYQYLLRNLPNALNEEIINQFSVDSTQFGQFAGIYYVAYCAAHIPLGLLLDKKGPKIIIPASIITCIIGTLPLIFSDSWSLAVLGRIVVGAGSSGAILGLFKVIHLGFSKDKFAKLLGLGVGVGLFFGAINGNIPIIFINKNFGYHEVLYFLTALGILLAIFAYFSIPKLKSTNLGQKQLMQDLKILSANKVLFIFAIFGGLLVGPLEGFADAWGSRYLVAAFGLTQERSIYLINTVFLGMTIGAVILPSLARNRAIAFRIIISCGAIMFFSMVALLFIQITNNLVLASILFVLGFFSGYQTIVVAKSADYVNEEQSTLATSVVNMLIMIFGYVNHSIIGILIDGNFNGANYNDNGLPVYSAENIRAGLISIPLMVLIGTVGFYMIRKVNKHSKI